MVAEQANSAPISNHLPFYETDRTFELLDKFVDSWNNQNTNNPLIPWFHKYICLICPFRYSLLSKQPILKRQPRDKWMLGNMPRKQDALPPVNAAVLFPNHFPSFSKPKSAIINRKMYHILYPTIQLLNTVQVKNSLKWDYYALAKAINSRILLIVLLA